MGQQLTMTPQLQQAIRLLQLSTLDLQQEIQEALESNPMLEREEDGDDFDNSNPLADGAQNHAPTPNPPAGRPENPGPPPQEEGAPPGHHPPGTPKARGNPGGGGAPCFSAPSA